jgi:hypothetical protein
MGGPGSGPQKGGTKKLTPGQLAKKKYGSSKRINAKVAKMAKKYPVKKSGSSKMKSNLFIPFGERGMTDSRGHLD